MRKKINAVIPSVKKGYDWKYCSVGGVTRVNVETGEDIAHLHELDQKMWTVLSCPVKGLEFDERTLALMDTDADGKIRVNEVIQASQWLCRVVADHESILRGDAAFPLNGFNLEDEEGKALHDTAANILQQLESKADEITVDDVHKYREMMADRAQATADAKMSDVEPVPAPFGEKYEEVEAAVDAVADKINDFFMRCRLVQYDEACADALDMSVERLAVVGMGNLAVDNTEIASAPIARPDKVCRLPLTEGINPAWQSAVDKFRSLVVAEEDPRAASLSPEMWNSVCFRLQAYKQWLATQSAERQKLIDEALAAEETAVTSVEKLVLLYRDFYKLLRNFVVMSDFYRSDNNAIFQAGQLFVDQRCCELCVRVDDLSKHADMAGQSGMFLIYCNCTSKVKNATMDIVAVLTDGDIDDLVVGKNAIFYDRNGLDWDATITKIVDNPISIRQAFWSPYRKFGNWVTEKITKSAMEKESKQFDEMTAKADTASANLAAQPAGEGTPAAAPDAKKAMPFDIAKFAGIFAAIGLAFGAIGGALAALGAFVMAKWYNVVLLVAAVILIISGPSMFLAWLKLRKRNLGPVLNANGWAINAKILVNVPFGATLTNIAQYPKLVLDDPFAEKKVPAWRKWLYAVAVVAVIVFAYLFFTHRLPWQDAKVETEAPAMEQVEAADQEPTAEVPIVAEE